MRTDALDLLAPFPGGATPRPEQARLLVAVADTIAGALDDPTAPRVFLVQAPPGVGKSHIAMTLARWSGDAYLLTSQKVLQDQYEREFGAELQIVKGRDNYACDHYPTARVPTSRGACRRPRAPLPRLTSADDYRPLLAEHLDRLEGRLAATRGELEALRPPESAADVFLRIPPSRAEQELIAQRDDLEAALARVHFFLDAEDSEWIVRYPADAAATLELVPLTVAAMVQELFAEAAELGVLSSAPLGPKRAVAGW